MSKDITEDILLKAGFNDTTERLHYTTYVRNNVIMIHFCDSSNAIRSWECRVSYNGYYATADIQTIDHFNKLMELMDIDFRLKEE